MTPEGKVESKEEAFLLFKIHRKDTIRVFRDTAYRMLTDGGFPSVTAREVINTMKNEGTYVDYENDCWSGAAFAGDARFVSESVAYLPGENYGDIRKEGRRAHGAYHVMRWRLR